MKFKFRKTQLAVAVAAAAVFGITTAADAASFVRVPTTANAQIANGGLSPAGGSESSGSEDASSSSATIALSEGSLSLQADIATGPSYGLGDAAYGFEASSPLSVTLNVSGGSTAISALGSSALNVAVPRGSLPLIFVAPSGDTAAVNKLTTSSGGAANIQWGVSTTGSCAGADYSSLDSYQPVVLPIPTSKVSEAYKLCVSTPAGESVPSGTYTGTFNVQLFSNNTGARLYPNWTYPGSRVTAPASVQCSSAPGSFQAGAIDKYDVYATTPRSASTPVVLECSNSSASDVQINYALSVPASAVAVGKNTSDGLTYTLALTGGSSGTATIPANSTNVRINPGVDMVVTIPAGQDVSVDTYVATAPITLTY